MFSIQEIATITQANYSTINHPDQFIEHLLIDSRKISFPASSLFFAIKGERHDGHRYIQEVIDKGVKNFIVEKEIELFANYPDINFLITESSVHALQKIAAAHRKKFDYPVIGITGSNGKTIIKEWLSQLLSVDFNIIKSPKSYNSQVGVPLSVWQMTHQHTLGIFEAGISKKNEMQYLEEVIKPTLGVFTNIGTAHDEGFENRQEKIKEKLKLFKNCSVVFTINKHDIDNDNPVLQENIELIPSPDSKKLDYRTIYFKYRDNEQALHLPFMDPASYENSITCLMVLLHFEIPIQEIQKRFDQLKPVSMRLELKQGINNSYLIDDSYNNDFAGLELALDFMEMQKQKNKKVVILSDLLETQSKDDENLYEYIAGMLKVIKIDGFIGVGKKLMQYRDFFQPKEENPSIKNKLQANFFNTTEELLQSPLIYEYPDSLVLIKGARAFEFEKIIQRLQQKTHHTLLEIDLNAMVHNLNFYRSLLTANTRLMVMVKAFAYGSGSIEVANLLQYHKVDYLAVAYSDEGVYLRQNGITLPIMVLNANPATFNQLLEYNLEPEIYSFTLLNAFLDFCHQIGKEDFKIHLKVDTGMKRLGFEPNEIDGLLIVLKEKLPSKAKIATIFSHLAAADEERHTDFSLHQILIFREATQKIEDVIGYQTIKHILNSPGIVRFPEAQFDMVRLGIGLYGIEVNQALQNNLEQIGTFKTSISQIKNITKGESVGYGRSFTAEKEMRIATIAIGYADGFSRKLSNGVGRVWLYGKEARVIGRVCMDMTMIDISEIEEAKEGDEVIIFSKRHSIFDYSKDLGTIPYEVLTSISERVKRIFFMG